MTREYNPAHFSPREIAAYQRRDKLFEEVEALLEEARKEMTLDEEQNLLEVLIDSLSHRRMVVESEIEDEEQAQEYEEDEEEEEEE